VREPVLADLHAVLSAVRRRLSAPARLYLVCRTTHLAEGWTSIVPALELAGDGRSPQVEQTAREAAEGLGVELVWESPADIIPLPDGWEQRARPYTADASDGPLDVRHFDPYSVVLRLIARGDEPDYVAALEYIHHGWVDPRQLEALFVDVTPRMTNQTLAQDPAEFRRKFKGLSQLYRRDHAAYSPGGTRVVEAAATA
jgi:hypothetical protein